MRRAGDRRAGAHAVVAEERLLGDAAILAQRVGARERDAVVLGEVARALVERGRVRLRPVGGDGAREFADKHGGDNYDVGELVDYIIDGGDASPGPQASEKSVDTSPVDLARLAGLAKKGVDTVTGAGASDSEEPAPTVKHMGPVQYAKDTPALPAPTKPEFDLSPDLKQKQKVPVKKDDDKDMAESAELSGILKNAGVING